MSSPVVLSAADLGPALLLATLLVGAVRRAGLSLAWSLAATAFSLAAAAIPVSGVTLGGHARAYCGDLSVISLAVLANGLAVSGFERRFFDPRSRLALLVFGAAAGALLFPMAMGLSAYDPYALGFRPTGLAVAAAAVATVLWFAAYRGAAIAILVAIVTYHLRLFDSANLWDYLVDPWIALFGPLALLRARAAIVLGRRA